MQLGVQTALCSPNQTSTPPFLAPRHEVVRYALSLTSLQTAIAGQWVSRIDGVRLVVGGFCRQPDHDPRKHAHVAPPFPSVVERLVGAILSRRIAPAQAIAIEEDNAAQDTPVINAWHAMALRKIGPQPLHLSFAQPI